jgi:hypothetical protein
VKVRCLIPRRGFKLINSVLSLSLLLFARRLRAGAGLRRPKTNTPVFCCDPDASTRMGMRKRKSEGAEWPTKWDRPLRRSQGRSAHVTPRDTGHAVLQVPRPRRQAGRGEELPSFLFCAPLTANIYIWRMKKGVILLPAPCAAPLYI